MRKLVVSEFLTLDGVMQAPGAPDEDTEGGFEHGGWQLPYFDDVDPAVADGLAAADALVLGRKTYEIFASYWPTASEDEPFTERMNSIDKYVASRTLDAVDWQNSTLLEGDVADAVAELKREPGGDLVVIGSGELVQTLMANDLVDEYLLMVHPLVLGTGKRLFREGEPTGMKLVEVETTDSGVVDLTYEPTGKAEGTQ
ncbi:dihydrofolate reductase family protein [Halorarum salinum]|uniref:Dihydrofolate reductase n=1 Tax=Halorarum salinum TaxID=2743089 RepID=A0A7D5L851_9EURY|nr:dihydrofolate reductase family protein [Halobaculum salinum]QLG60251.1 dihydrofolate reductase [Halobaculum salinum]